MHLHSSPAVGVVLELRGCSMQAAPAYGSWLDPPCALAHKSVRQPRIVLEAVSRVQTQGITSFLPACPQTCMFWVHSLPGLSGGHRLVRNNEQEMQASNRRPFGHIDGRRDILAALRRPALPQLAIRRPAEYRKLGDGPLPSERQRGPPSKEQHYSMFTAETSQQPRVAPQHTARTTSGRQHPLHVGVDSTAARPAVECELAPAACSD